MFYYLPPTGMKTDDFKIELTQWIPTTKQLSPSKFQLLNTCFA